MKFLIVSWTEHIESCTSLKLYFKTFLLLCFIGNTNIVETILIMIELGDEILSRLQTISMIPVIRMMNMFPPSCCGVVKITGDVNKAQVSDGQEKLGNVEIELCGLEITVNSRAVVRVSVSSRVVGTEHADMGSCVSGMRIARGDR